MSTEARAPLSVLDECLCTALAVGLVLVALLPGARGMSAIGWLPMWLVGMPAVAWWAVRGFPLPGRAGAVDADAPQRRAPRRVLPQARRRGRSTARPAVRRAA